MSASPSAGAVSWRAATSTCTSATWAASSARAGLELVGVRHREDDGGLARLVLELERRALGDDPAVVDDDDAVGELVGLLEVLRRQQQRRAVADEAAQHVPQLDAAARVEAGGRLVEEEHRRRRDEADREVEPAPHAAGVVLDDPVAGVGEREPLEQLVGQPARPRARGRP